MTNIREPLSDSLEDYMEAIFHIEAQKHAARAKDIADRLQVSNSSVTGALRLLADKGLINYAPYDIITMTQKGRDVAQGVVRRHNALRDFFVHVLGIDPVEAEEAACKMEHGVSSQILHRIKQFIEFLASCPPECQVWLQTFNNFCAAGKHVEETPENREVM